jgi:hypothetical protein
MKALFFIFPAPPRPGAGVGYLLPDSALHSQVVRRSVAAHSVAAFV